MYLLCSCCIAKHLLLLRWVTGKMRDRFGGMVRFKGGSIIDVFKEINFEIYCKYIVKTCMYTISAYKDT